MRRYRAARRIRVLAIPPLLGAVLAGAAPVAATAGWAGPASRLASVRGGGILYGVAEISGRSAWAVGQTGGSLSTRPRTLILRWNGGAWRRLPSPTRASGRSLTAVAVTSAGRAWAVGQTGRATLSTLIERWNGTRWRIVPGPNPAHSGALFGVAAVSARSAWAVGESPASFSAKLKTLILRWNGAAWRRVPSPNAATPGSYLAAVAAASPSSAWLSAAPATARR
jgi:hypothetical protein